MKNKAFTLVELLAIIALLGLLTILITTNVLELKDKKEVELDESKKKILYSDASSYIYDNMDKYKINSGNVFCIQVNNLKHSIETHDFDDYFVRVVVDDNEKLNYNLAQNCTEKNN